jgi:hypothetical protein
MSRQVILTNIKTNRKMMALNGEAALAHPNHPVLRRKPEAIALTAVSA